MVPYSVCSTAKITLHRQHMSTSIGGTCLAIVNFLWWFDWLVHIPVPLGASPCALSSNTTRSARLLLAASEHTHLISQFSSFSIFHHPSFIYLWVFQFKGWPTPVPKLWDLHIQGAGADGPYLLHHLWGPRNIPNLTTSVWRSLGSRPTFIPICVNLSMCAAIHRIISLALNLCDLRQTWW